ESEMPLQATPSGRKKQMLASEIVSLSGSPGSGSPGRGRWGYGLGCARTDNQEPGRSRPKGGCPYGFRRERRSRHRHMFMHCLPLIVVLGMKLAVRTGDRLRRLVGFEAQVARLVLLGQFFLAEAVVAQHKV